jgi:signal transduction histidine kinase
MEITANMQGHANLDRLRAQLDAMGETLHRVARELRPTSLDDLEFSTALSNYLVEWSMRTGVQADFEFNHAHLDELSSEATTALYRIVQEALTNVAKHAQNANNVSVVIDGAQDRLRLTIEDDGRGFDLEAAVGPGSRKGLGLAGIQERIAMIGGSFEIESTVGFGTTIFVEIPVAA